MDDCALCRTLLHEVWRLWRRCRSAYATSRPRSSSTLLHTSFYQPYGIRIPSRWAPPVDFYSHGKPASLPPVRKPSAGQTSQDHWYNSKLPSKQLSEGLAYGDYNIEQGTVNQLDRSGNRLGASPVGRWQRVLKSNTAAENYFCGRNADVLYILKIIPVSAYQSIDQKYLWLGSCWSHQKKKVLQL